MTSAARIRLPIAGENALDVAIKELSYDESWGRDIFEGTDAIGYCVAQRVGNGCAPNERLDLLWSIDHHQDPYQTSIEDCHAFLRTKWIYVDDDEDERETDEHGDAYCSDIDGRTAWNDEFDLSREDFAYAVEKYRTRWLYRKLRAAGFRLRTHADLKHNCSMRVLPIDPWPEQAGVYFAAIGERVKIGKAKNVRERLVTIMTGAPAKYSLLAVAPGGLREETQWHQRFKHLREHGEWFRLTQEVWDAVLGIRRAA